MHRVLQVPEVLLNIFCHCVPSDSSNEDRQSVNSALAALARTCRTFKEPALDALWSELDDPTPLVRCLPEISVAVGTIRWHRRSRMAYSFSRPLERAEWDILYSYSRRVWCMRDFETLLDWSSVKTSVNFTPVNPLFPNLRFLDSNLAKETVPLLHLPFPSLVRLSIRFFWSADLLISHNPLKSLVKTSPNIKRLTILGPKDDRESNKIVSDGIRGWSNLHTLECHSTFLDADTLTHLLHTPALTRLAFTLNAASLDQIITSPSLSFLALTHLELFANSLASISSLLSWAQLPAITNLTAISYSRPSKQDLASFMAGIHLAGASHAIQELDLGQSDAWMDTTVPEDPDSPLLDWHDLQPCMEFRRLRRMRLDLHWDVDLSDDGLLTLASTWPLLEELLINEIWGWSGPGGITPNGLALLLQTCPFLTSVALAIDTRGYTRPPARQFREPVGSSAFGRPFRINVLDSAIGRASMAAMTAFFPTIVPHFHFILTTRNESSDSGSESEDQLFGPVAYRERWEQVYNQANEVIKMRWLNVVQELLFQRH